MMIDSDPFSLMDPFTQTILNEKPIYNENHILKHLKSFGTAYFQTNIQRYATTNREIFQIAVLVGNRSIFDKRFSNPIGSTHGLAWYNCEIISI